MQHLDACRVGAVAAETRLSVAGGEAQLDAMTGRHAAGLQRHRVDRGRAQRQLARLELENRVGGPRRIQIGVRCQRADTVAGNAQAAPGELAAQAVATGAPAKRAAQSRAAGGIGNEVTQVAEPYRQRNRAAAAEVAIGRGVQAGDIETAVVDRQFAALHGRLATAADRVTADTAAEPVERRPPLAAGRETATAGAGVDVDAPGKPWPQRRGVQPPAAGCDGPLLCRIEVDRATRPDLAAEESRRRVGDFESFRRDRTAAFDAGRWQGRAPQLALHRVIERRRRAAQDQRAARADDGLSPAERPAEVLPVDIGR